MSRPIIISAEERDALYDQILDRLSGIGDLWMVIRGERYREADRLGREVSDDLRVVLDDLGWGDGDGQSIELTSQPDVLRRVLSRHCEAALHREASEVSERAETRSELDEAEARNQEVVRLCGRILAELDLAEAG